MNDLQGHHHPRTPRSVVNITCQTCNSCNSVIAKKIKSNTVPSGRQFPLPPGHGWACPELVEGVRASPVPDTAVGVKSSMISLGLYPSSPFVAAGPWAIPAFLGIQSFFVMQNDWRTGPPRILASRARRDGLTTPPSLQTQRPRRNIFPI